MVSFWQYIRGLNPLINDDRMTLRLRVSSDNNYPEADLIPREYGIKIHDLRAFLAGFTVTPTGIDGSCDWECKIEILDVRAVYTSIQLDGYVGGATGIEDIHAAYVLWTDDGAYNDQRLSFLQSCIARDHTLVKDRMGKRMALCIDGFDTLFVDGITDQPFYRGLEVFQELANACSTSIVTDSVVNHDVDDSDISEEDVD